VPAKLRVAEISSADHLEFLRGRSSASFLQTPAWAQVKSEWGSLSLGWFRDASSLGSSTQGIGDELVGVGLVLLRQLPKVKRYLAYLPEGPVLDWDTDDLGTWLAPMTAHLKARGAFAVRMGPPVVLRRWDAAAVKAGIAEDAVHRLGDIPPAERTPTGARVVGALERLGWRKVAVEGGFSAGQPAYNFQVPLAGKSEDDVLKGMNQQWRRNIKKAAKAGVEVSRGSDNDLKAFHDLYAHTAERDHFTPRPLSYFQTMFDAMNAEEPDRITLWLGRHEGDLVAATISVRVGTHVWYSYGASSTEKREVRGSNAVQWAMIQDALAHGAEVYDLRGITDTLDSDDPHVGLIQFKVGTGGEAVEYAGEWDLPLNPLLYKGFELYLKRRGG
jgi:vancomycin resistance protein VanK